MASPYHHTGGLCTCGGVGLGGRGGGNGLLGGLWTSRINAAVCVTCDAASRARDVVYRSEVVQDIIIVATRSSAAIRALRFMDPPRKSVPVWENTWQYIRTFRRKTYALAVLAVGFYG